MAAPIRIAVLDDQPAAGVAARETLGALGYDVRTATSLPEFEAMVDRFDPQVILLDVRMPDVPGDVVCQALKKNVTTANTPILLYSSLAEAALARHVRRAGADGYICKTWGPEALKARLEALADEVLF